MPLKLMYITNRPEVARIAEAQGVERIFLDMEYIGKAQRQGGLNTVQNHHSVEDVRSVRAAIERAELLVRVNPIHDGGEADMSSKQEIDAVIEAGADIVMLPYFKTLAEVQKFLALVDGRARTSLLLETAEAVERLDAILQLDGIDEVHIGLNDLSLSRGDRFMFEPLADGTVEEICHKLKRRGAFYGIGGIAAPGRGLVPAELIIREHYRLGSRAAILSRSFCDAAKCGDLDEIRETFRSGVRAIRELEQECAVHAQYFSDNQRKLRAAVDAALAQMGGGAAK